MMDDRDDWPDGILERDLDGTGELDPAERPSAERIARDERNMNAVLSAMAEQVSERLPTPIHGQAAPARRRGARRWLTVAPVAAAAAIAGLILMRGEETGEGGEPVPSPTPSMVSELNVEAERPFMVFPTSDPNIAVVWLLNPKESD